MGNDIVTLMCMFDKFKTFVNKSDENLFGFTQSHIVFEVMVDVNKCTLINTIVRVFADTCRYGSITRPKPLQIKT